MTHTYVVDSGGTSRQVKRCFVVDSGGTSRQLKKIWVIDSGGTSRLVYTAAVTLSMVAGETSSGGGGDGPTYYTYGYSAGSFGTLSPTKDPAGNTVSFITYAENSGTMNLGIEIASAPTAGRNYLSSMLVSGTTYTGAAASLYNYSGGIASWEWPIGGGITDGSTYPVVLTI